MDHGGNLDQAIAQFGGQPSDWLDLSTGINRDPYAVPKISPRAWTALPTARDMADLRAAAAQYYGTRAAIAPLAGAQMAIQMLPALRPIGRMAYIAPTYNEYANVFAQGGWITEAHAELTALEGADIAVVVNPNNPDGRLYRHEDLIALSRKVGLLVVDESFMDMTPEHSVIGAVGGENILVLRSFGKFFGLAGLRLGFAIGEAGLCAELAAKAGPWPVSGAAIEVATTAFTDKAWIEGTKQRLADISQSLRALPGLTWQGGTGLFNLYTCDDSTALQTALARHRIWTRRFPWSPHALRIGCPAQAEQSAFLSALRAAVAHGADD